MSGEKHDNGKPEMALLEDFGLALLAVGHVATFGAKKYSRGGWQSVPDALYRYKSAAARHRAMARYEELDRESQLPHRWHVLWNEMCVLEIIERENHNKTELSKRRFGNRRAE